MTPNRLQVSYFFFIVIMTICTGSKSYQVSKGEIRRLTREADMGNGKGATNKAGSLSQEDEDKKTLAQQVIDGKYGLIQSEIFSSPVKRPGVLGYEINPEVPRDNINNFGGLKEEEIWLAENHLLVLKGGGSFNTNLNGEGGRKKEDWPPIDNYMAPKRRVKIPPNPRVPPPFPVQLEEGGPIEILTSGIGEKREKEPLGSLLQLHPLRGGGGGRRRPPSLLLPPPPFNHHYNRPLPFPPPLDPSEVEDEDDPRIYYPPPYDFILEEGNQTHNNNHHVPPGPIVPGIVLPPPPDFFSPLVKPSPKRLLSYKNHQQMKTNKAKMSSTSTTTTTRKPSLSQTSPNNTEKKPKEHMLKTNQVQQKNNKPKPDLIQRGWIPISGPPLASTTTTTTTRPQVKEKGKNVQNVTSIKYPHHNNSNRYYKILDSTIRGSYGLQNMNRENKYSSTSPPNDNFEPLIFNLRTQIGTTVRPAISYPVSFNGDNKIKETYYFYQDPHELRGKVVETVTTPGKLTKKPNVKLHQEGHQINFDTNTLAPPKMYEEASISSEDQNISTFKPNNYDPSYVQSQVEDYPFVYYHNKNNPLTKYSSNTHQVPREHYGSSALEYFENPGNNRDYNKEQSTSKTPIYEYSFSAPGYGKSKPPKISTTPKPLNIDISSQKQPQYSFYEYHTTPTEKNIFTYNPGLYVTQKPNFDEERTHSGIHTLFQTNNPFNKFITRNSGSMEDLNKKYFTLFGQKLNHAHLNEPITTPLPPAPQNQQKKPYYKEAFRGMLSDEVKDVQESLRYQPQPYYVTADDSYYIKTQDYLQNYKVIVKPGTNLQEHNKFSSFYSTALPYYDQYEYDRVVVRPNHPLTSDLEVNYRQRPNINPDAELVDTHLINRQNLGSNSYISYQLPGSGGHFYFLTPRSTENYHLANPGFQYFRDKTQEYRNERNQQKK